MTRSELLASKNAVPNSSQQLVLQKQEQECTFTYGRSFCTPLSSFHSRISDDVIASDSFDPRFESSVSSFQSMLHKAVNETMVCICVSDVGIRTVVKCAISQIRVVGNDRTLIRIRYYYADLCNCVLAEIILESMYRVKFNYTRFPIIFR